MNEPARTNKDKKDNCPRAKVRDFQVPKDKPLSVIARLGRGTSVISSIPLRSLVMESLVFNHTNNTNERRDDNLP